MYKKIYRNMCLLAFVTLFLSALLTTAAFYTYFEEDTSHNVASELKLAVAALDGSADMVSEAKSLEDSDTGITLSDGKGRIIYDSLHEDAGHLAEASFEKPHKYKCPICNRRFLCASTTLPDGTTVTLYRHLEMIPHKLYGIMIALLFIMALVYVVTAIAASVLTDNITKPIKDIDPYRKDSLDEIYEEIRPFLKKIASQSEEIGRQTEQVSEQKARIRAIMDNINEGLVIIDKGYRVLSANSPALDIFRRAERDVLHKSLFSLTDKEEIDRGVKLSLSGKKGSVMYESGERTYEIFHSPVYEGDSVAGVVLLLLDVTERNEAEKIRREFTANVSHELKTPLTTIHGYAQIIDKGIARPEDVAGFAGKIEKESSRLMALVNDIIELSHLDEGTEDAPRQDISLQAVVREVTESLTPRAEAMKVTLELPDADTTVRANLSQITELVYNLTDNAIRYNKQGGRVVITIGPGFIEIADTGIGIPGEYMDRIFERFFRVDKSHSKLTGGTGLGLSIVKHIAKQNGARIEAKSTPGQGSSFKVLFENH